MSKTTKKVTKKKVKKKATKIAPKRKVGRPSKWDTADKDYIKFLFETGNTDRQVAKKIGVDEKTVNNWKKEHKEFFQSLKDWKHFADGEVEISLYQRAKGYSVEEEKVFCDAKTGMLTTKIVTKHYPPDPTAMIFWLKNRQSKNWRDKREIELGEETKKSFNFSIDVNPDEVDK